MPAAVSKPTSSPPQKVEKEPEKDRDFSVISIWEKIKYIASKIPIGDVISSLKYTPNKWKPASIEWQNTEYLRNLKWRGVSALTAVRVAAFVVFAGIIVSSVFAAPVIGAMALTSTLPLALVLLVGTYNLLFLLITPSNDDDTSYTKKAIEMVAKKVEDSPPNIFDVQTAIDRKEYEKRKKHSKDGPKENDVATENGEPAPRAKPDKPAAEPGKPPTAPVKPPEANPDSANPAKDPMAIEARKISQGPKFANATKKLCFATTALNAEMTPAILAKPLPALAPANKFETKFAVVAATSTQLAEKLAQEPGFLRPAVLNMANEKTPGGTFLTGGNAQEERLCQQSNLYEALDAAHKAKLYPIHEFGAIYTPQVTFFKDDANKLIDEPFQIDVITSAAYNCGTGSNRPKSDDEYRDGTKKKIQAMLRAALLNGNNALVLSAFGCGVFGNDPTFMSNLFKEVLTEKGSEFEGRFQFVVFAIPGGRNLEAFKKTFADKIAAPPPPA